MWWNIYSTMTKRMMFPFADFTDNFSDTKSPTPSASSQIDRMLKEIKTDISAMTARERERVKAELASQARQWCVQDISHDLRTPLNAIIGFTQMMESGVLGPVGNAQYLEYLRHIRESGYELLGKVEDLIDTVVPDSFEAAPAKQHAYA